MLKICKSKISGGFAWHLQGYVAFCCLRESLNRARCSAPLRPRQAFLGGDGVDMGWSSSVTSLHPGPLTAHPVNCADV